MNTRHVTEDLTVAAAGPRRVPARGVAALAASASCVLALAGCTGAADDVKPPVAAPAAVTQTATPNGTTAPVAATTSPPAKAATTSPPAKAVVTSPPSRVSAGGARPRGKAAQASARLVLTDKGVGGLQLGMTKKQAQASGFLGAPAELGQDESPESCQIFTGKRGVDLVYLLGGRVVIIAVGKAIPMAKGIGVGSTYAQVHAKYPDAGRAGMGRLYVPAPGAPFRAAYRLGMDSAGDNVFPEDKVTEIALQSSEQGCYE